MQRIIETDLLEPLESHFPHSQLLWGQLRKSVNLVYMAPLFFTLPLPPYLKKNDDGRVAINKKINL